MCRQLHDGVGDGVADSFSTMTSKSRAVLYRLDLAVALHARQMQKHSEARGALYGRVK